MKSHCCDLQAVVTSGYDRWKVSGRTQCAAPYSCCQVNLSGHSGPIRLPIATNLRYDVTRGLQIRPITFTSLDRYLYRLHTVGIAPSCIQIDDVTPQVCWTLLGDTHSVVEKCRRWHAQFDVCLVSNNQNETHHRDTMAYSSTKGGKVLLMCHTAAKTQCDSEPVNQLSKLSFWPRCIYGFHVYSPIQPTGPTAHWSYGSMSIVIQPTGPTAHCLVLQPIGPTAHWSYH